MKVLPAVVSWNVAQTFLSDLESALRMQGVDWPDAGVQQLADRDQLLQALGDHDAPVVLLAGTGPDAVSPEFLAAVRRMNGDASIIVITASGEGNRWDAQMVDAELAPDWPLPAQAALMVTAIERRSHRRRLQHAVRTAEEAVRARLQFMATMSHEIRTPMNGVIGMTELLCETHLDGEQRDYVETLRTAGEGLVHLINDMLDYARGQSGKLVLEAIPFSLAQVTREVVSLFSGQARQQGVALQLQIADDLPPRLRGDPHRLRQILMNLVSNAVKFSPQGDVRVAVDGAISDLGVYQARISISDTGIGIGEDAMARLFQPFEQADGDTRRRFGGSGLGLAISKSLLDLMDGTIEAQSEVGKGSRFTVHLDLEVVEDDRHDQTAMIASTECLLLISEDQDLLSLWRRSASRLGLTSYAAGDAVSALGMIEELDPEQIKAILIDCDLKDVDAVMLTRLIRIDRRASRLPVVWGVRDLERIRGAAGDLAVDAIVARDANGQVLRDQVQSLLEARESGTTIYRRSRRVLVVEDNPVNQRVAAKLLANCGCIVTCADNGHEAVLHAEQRRFDMILMDCRMPILDGLEGTRQIRDMERREGRKPTPILALTGDTGRDTIEACLDAGMDGHLSKPLRLVDLERVLDDWFAERRPRR